MQAYTYYPILKWKTGERKALKGIPTPDKRFIPVFQFVDDEIPMPGDFFTAVKEHYIGPFYFDTWQSDNDERELLLQYTEYASAHSIEAWPLLYPDDLETVLESVSKYTSRFGVNIPVPEDAYSTEQLLKTLQPKSRKSIDLFLDAGVVSTRQLANVIYFAYKNLLTMHEKELSEFNKIIVCLSSFPEVLDCESGGIATYNRYDIKIFSKLLKQFEKASIAFSYSDYGVTKFTETNLDPRLLSRVLPKVKYTTIDSYVVYKGKKDWYTKQMIRSYIDIAKDLIKSSYYFGKDFSAGDAAIYQKATQANAGPGNAVNWVEFNANHHIVVLIEQLSNLSDV